MDWKELQEDTTSAMRQQELKAEQVISKIRLALYSVTFFASMVQTVGLGFNWQTELFPAMIAFVIALGMYLEIHYVKKEIFTGRFYPLYSTLVVVMDVLLISSLILTNLSDQRTQALLLELGIHPLTVISLMTLLLGVLFQFVDVFRFNVNSSYLLGGSLLLSWVAQLFLYLWLFPQYEFPLEDGLFVTSSLFLGTLVILLSFLSAFLSGRIQTVIFRSLKQDTLERFLPDSVVKEVLKKEEEEEKIAGGAREVSVLFADIVGFTQYSENRNPGEIMDLLNGALEVMIDCVFENGGVLDKIIGDGIMAIFGIYDSPEIAAQQAVAAGLSMVKRFSLWNQERIQQGQTSLALSVGIHSGPVIVGTVGNRKRLDFTAIGDTVNTASRVEGLTRKIGQPLVFSQQTEQLLAGSFRTTCSGHFQLRGKGADTQIFHVMPAGPPSQQPLPSTETDEG